MEMLPPRRSGPFSSPRGLSWPAGTDAEALGAGQGSNSRAGGAGRSSNSRAGGAGRGSNSRGGWCRSCNVEGGRCRTSEDESGRCRSSDVESGRGRSDEVKGRRSGRGGGRTTMGCGRSVAATSGAQGLAHGVGADDGAAASGCGVRRASTFNPPATRREEGR